MKDIVVIAHDMRSTFNVGSLLRTCEGLGISKLYLTGYTPYPKAPSDTRLPHIADRLDRQINKTSLESHTNINWEHNEDVTSVIKDLKKSGYAVVALEQSKESINLFDFKPQQKIAILLGTEVTGVPPELIQLCDLSIEIPMYGKKESFNVVQAAAMTLYHVRFFGKIE